MHDLVLSEGRPGLLCGMMHTESGGITNTMQAERYVHRLTLRFSEFNSSMPVLS